MAKINENFKKVLVLIFIIIVTMLIVSNFRLKSEIDKYKEENLVLKYKTKEVNRFELEKTELLKQKELQEKINYQLKKELKKRNEEILSIAQVNAQLIKKIEIKEVEIVQLNDSLKNLVLKVDSLYNLKINDEKIKDAKSVLVFKIKEKDNYFNLNGKLVAFFKDSVLNPIKSYLNFDTIQFKLNFQVVQTVSKNNLIRVYFNYDNPYIKIDSSKLYLDFDFAKNTFERKENEDKIGFLLGGGIQKEFSTNNNQLLLGTGIIYKSLQLQLLLQTGLGNKSNTINLSLYKQF
jgi:hypothetical protein